MHALIPEELLQEPCVQDIKTSAQTAPLPKATTALNPRKPCAMDRALAIPELSHAIAQFLLESGVLQVSLVCRQWHELWSPYQWHTLVLSSMRPPFPSSLIPSEPTEASPVLLSSHGLARYGSHVVQLKAPWLTLEELQALSLHCPHLQVLTLDHFTSPCTLFGPMLSRWRELRVLSLEVAEVSVEDERPLDRIDRVGLLQTIAESAWPGLERIELTFQCSVKMNLDLLFNVLKSCSSLKTLKLTDADIIDAGKMTTKSHRHRKNKELCSLNNAGSNGAEYTGINAQRKHSAQEGEKGSTGQGDGPEWADLVGPFGLRCLCISSSYISDSILESILECCPRLENLQLYSCVKVTDKTLGALTRLNSRLRRLSLLTCKLITSEGLIELFEGIKDLRQIHLYDLPLIRDDCLEVLVKHHGHSLERVNIYFAALLTERGIKSILTECGNLRVLGFHAYGSSLKLFEIPWASSRTLEQLDLQNSFKQDVASSALRTEAMGGSGSGGTIASAEEIEDDHPGCKQGRPTGFMAMAIGRLLSSLPRLWDLSLQAKGLERQLIEGFGTSQRIRLLHFYGLQSASGGSYFAEPIPWRNLRKGYPHLRRFGCGAFGTYRATIKEELAKVDIEFQPSSAISNMVFESDF